MGRSHGRSNNLVANSRSIGAEPNVQNFWLHSWAPNLNAEIAIHLVENNRNGRIKLIGEDHRILNFWASPGIDRKV